ncbi:hypothetical protein HYQ46_012214 [Verticillium longisporum]|nr:hypothetical protein HYQ46_012214 [Verticillium longisporum]
MSVIPLRVHAPWIERMLLMRCAGGWCQEIGQAWVKIGYRFNKSRAIRQSPICRDRKIHHCSEDPDAPCDGENGEVMGTPAGGTPKVVPIHRPRVVGEPGMLLPVAQKFCRPQPSQAS